MTLTENDLKETFGTRVKLPVTFINYQAYERSIKGINKEIKLEQFSERRKMLFKIRSQMMKVLNEL
jgi:hypothetical protein